MQQIVLKNNKLPTSVSILFLAWAIFFAGLVQMLYRSEIKAQEITSLSLDPNFAGIVEYR